MRERIAKDLAQVRNVEFTEILEYADYDDSMRWRWCDLVHRLTETANLTDYHGVRRTQYNAGSFEDLYEIY